VVKDGLNNNKILEDFLEWYRCSDIVDDIDTTIENFIISSDYIIEEFLYWFIDNTKFDLFDIVETPKKIIKYYIDKKL
jgi:hypothetical protein